MLTERILFTEEVSSFFAKPYKFFSLLSIFGFLVRVFGRLLAPTENEKAITSKYEKTRPQYVESTMGIGVGVDRFYIQQEWDVVGTRRRPAGAMGNARVVVVVLLIAPGRSVASKKVSPKHRKAFTSCPIPVKDGVEGGLAS